jgi:hypothetical protein
MTVLAIVLAAQNTDNTTVEVFAANYRAPLIVVILAAAITGVILDEISASSGDATVAIGSRNAPNCAGSAERNDPHVRNGPRHPLRTAGAVTAVAGPRC